MRIAHWFAAFSWASFTVCGCATSDDRSGLEGASGSGGTGTGGSGGGSSGVSGSAGLAGSATSGGSAGLAGSPTSGGSAGVSGASGGAIQGGAPQTGGAGGSGAGGFGGAPQTGGAGGSGAGGFGGAPQTGGAGGSGAGGFGGAPQTGGAGGAGAGGVSGGGTGGTGLLGPVDCQPDCAGVECGSDQCGSVCGTCPPEQLCRAGRCTDPGEGGDVVVDSTVATHRINPEIYGAGYVSAAQFAELEIPVNRFGGNATTRYNFRNNRSNAAQDWYFLNGDGPSEGTPGTDEFYGEQDLFVRRTLAAGAAPLITISTIGWVAKDATGSEKQCGFPRSLFPDQQDFWECGADWCAPDCGNGKTPGGENIPGADTLPSLTSIAVDSSFAAEQVTHLVSRFGAAYRDRPHYYQLDNEMNLWSYTHRDVHRQGTTYEEVWQKTVEYAPAIRAADPNGRILGYGTWNIMDVADIGDGRQDHDGLFLLEWYLRQLADYERVHGERLVDCVDLHFYPILDGAVEANVLNATRPLWDPDFAITDWQRYIFDSEHIRLIPRVREWIQAYYPGTGICLTEYNLHPESPLSALVQADALGLFGREGLTMAAFWRATDWEEPDRLGPYLAFRMYLNYDGNGGKFGEDSLSTAVTSHGDDVSAYAARRSSDGALTLLLINRAASAQTLRVTLLGSQATRAEVWSYAVGDTAIASGGSVALSAGAGDITLPARAMRLLVVP